MGEESGANRKRENRTKTGTRSGIQRGRNHQNQHADNGKRLSNFKYKIYVQGFHITHGITQFISPEMLTMQESKAIWLFFIFCFSQYSFFIEWTQSYFWFLAEKGWFRGHLAHWQGQGHWWRATTAARWSGQNRASASGSGTGDVAAESGCLAST